MMGFIDWTDLPESFLSGLSACPSARKVCMSWAKGVAQGVSKLTVTGLPPREEIFNVFPFVLELQWTIPYTSSVRTA